MQFKRLLLVFTLTRCFGIALCALLAACGGSGGSEEAGPATGYTVTGKVQKGPFALGSQVSVNEQTAALGPNGKVYNVQTSDDFGSFAVGTPVGSNLVEIVATGFYLDELTGQLAAAPIQLRAIADLSVNTNPTVNVLTSLQAPRLRALVAQGQSFPLAQAQSQTEVLAALGIDAGKVAGLSTLYSMQINGSNDADAVLLAASAVLSRMAIVAAATNGTSPPAELSNFVNTIAAQLVTSGTLSNPVIQAARAAAATQIDLGSLRANLEAYYANRGSPIIAPKFEEWIDKDGSGVLPRRLLPVAGIAFPDAASVEPQQTVTSAEITVGGVGTGVAVPVSVDANTTLIKNGIAVNGGFSTARDGDTIALRTVASGYARTKTSTVQVGSSIATWRVASKGLGGTISGLTGSGLVLQNNGGDDIVIAPGSTTFSFPGAVDNGGAYAVTVLTPPTSPFQTCTVSQGHGVVGTAPSNVGILCTTPGRIVYAIAGGVLYAFLSDAASGALRTASAGPDATSATRDWISLHPTDNLAYIIFHAGNSSAVRAYAIDATGALISTDNVISGGRYRVSAIDPSGQHLYVLGQSVLGGNQEILPFGIDTTTGALSPDSTLTLANSPAGMLINPTGTLAYLASAGSTNFDAYAVDAVSGTLTLLGARAMGRVFQSASGPYSIAFAPSGQFLYVANFATNDVSIFTVDGATGVLGSVGTAASGAGPTSIAIHPTGKFAYVTNSGADTISVYAANTSAGTLTSLGPAVATAGSQPSLAVIDASGTFAFVAGKFGISAYRIDTSTGALTAVGTLPTGGSAATSLVVKTLP